MPCPNIGQMKLTTNLYRDSSGNVVTGRYIYARPNKRFSAMCKYPEGYTKGKMCYTFEEAVAFIEGDYEKYAPGWYYNTDMEMVFLRRPNDPRPPRMY